MYILPHICISIIHLIVVYYSYDVWHSKCKLLPIICICVQISCRGLFDQHAVFVYCSLYIIWLMCVFYYIFVCAYDTWLVHLILCRLANRIIICLCWLGNGWRFAMEGDLPIVLSCKIWYQSLSVSSLLHKLCRCVLLIFIWMACCCCIWFFVYHMMV